MDLLTTYYLLVSIQLILLLFLVKVDGGVIILKPSFVVSVFILVSLNMGTFFYFDYLEYSILNADLYIYITNIFNICLLLWSGLSFRKSYANYFKVVSKYNNYSFLKHIKVLFIIMCFVAFIYLLFVPLNRTGLYAILIDSSDYDYIRESSFTFGVPTYIRYLFYFVTSCIGPILIANIASNIYKMKSRSIRVIFTKNTKSLIVLFITLVIVTLYGARGPSTLLVITFVYSLMVLSNRRKISITKILLYGSLALIFPALITLFRNDLMFNLDSFYFSYSNIFDRAFGRGILPNMWFFDYHAINGDQGVSGIPKLAYIFGIEGRNIQNEISLIYDPQSLETGTATATFFVQYYLLFGIIGLVIAFLFVCLMDYSVIIFSFKFKNYTSYLYIVCFFPIAVQLSFSQISTIILSKGVIFCLTVLLLFNYFARIRKSL